MPINVDAMVKKMQERIASGLLFLGSAYITDYASERLARKYTKEYSELAVGFGTAAVAELLGLKRYLGAYDKYAEYILDGMSDYGFLKSIYDAKIKKKPMAWFEDANTIHVINMDADTLSDGTNTYVTVYIDDAQATVSAVDGSPSDFKISLSSPVAEGWHKLVIIAGNTKKDTFRTDKAYAPA